MRNLLRLLRPARFMRRRAIYSGLFGGNRTWLAIGGLAWVMRWVRSLFGAGDPQTVYLEELKPGQRLVVSHPGSDRDRAKSARKQSKKADKASKKADKAAKSSDKRRRSRSD